MLKDVDVYTLQTLTRRITKRLRNMLEGTLKNRDGKLYVVYSTTDYARPVRVILWWTVVKTTNNPYNANRPSAGDKATSRGGGQWSTFGANGPSGGVSTGSGSTQAEFREEVEVMPPPARGKELRWRDGQWEKLMAKGWVPAGEGKGKATSAPADHHATKKSPAQLQREIDEVLSSPGSFSYEEAMDALEKKHAGVKRGGSLRSGHAPVVPQLTGKTRWAPSPQEVVMKALDAISFGERVAPNMRAKLVAAGLVDKSGRVTDAGQRVLDGANAREILRSGSF
jgi:hypothetical protein